MARTPEQTYITLFFGTYNVYITGYINDDTQRGIISFIKERIPNFLKSDPSIVATAYSLTQIKASPNSDEFKENLEQKIVNLRCTKKMDDDIPIYFDIIRYYRMML